MDAARILLVILALAGAGRLAAQPIPYDLVLRNARIIDGSGNPWYRGDIAIRGDSIVGVGGSITGSSNRTVDVMDQVVAPGFIDVHTHSRENLFRVPTADNFVRQGVTTILEGPDGNSPVPLAPFLASLDSLAKSVNIGSFIGHGSVRSAVMGETDRAPTADEMEAMRALVEQGMRDGAFGLSTGLFYVPGAFSKTEEVIELAEVAGRLGGIHISHMRDETSRIVESVSETIEIGERGGLPTQVTHHKVIGTANWGRSVETLRLIDEARQRGVDVTLDQYPYTASSTSVQAALLPAWAREGGRAQLLSRLSDPVTRERVKTETVRIIVEERGGGDLGRIAIALCDWDSTLSGKNLEEIVRGRGMEPTLDNGAETVLWLVEQGTCGGIFHVIDELDLERILRHPATMIASDGFLPIFGEAVPHPRGYGTFARVLGRYVREKAIITLEDAVRKMTSLPAQRLGLTDRGLLRPGMKADIVVFDPSTVRDAATFENPHQYAEGVSFGIVNGEIVFDGHAMTTARPGRVLYGPARRLSRAGQ